MKVMVNVIPNLKSIAMLLANTEIYIQELKMFQLKVLHKFVSVLLVDTFKSI